MEQLHSTLKILLVEPNFISQRAILKHLSILGFDADVATNVQQAIDRATQKNYDLVLLGDEAWVSLGEQIVATIRRFDRDRFRRTVIIAMVSNPFPHVHTKEMATSIDDFLSIPLQYTDLEMMLQWWGRFVLSVQQFNDFEGLDFPLPIVETLLPALPMNQHIDWIYIRQLADGNGEFALELLTLFVEDSLKQLKILEEAILTNNLLQMEQVAHYLKGASANVGAIAMQTVAEKLEHQARYHRMQDPSHLLQELNQSLLWIQRYIKVQQS
ncbi:MAG: hypothetical protein HC881_04770 [Leptolyngbyaceae cyanobacterium SL_7_1]|nr:hypothetical protein [Leptolyngbyaceae cyanobacterium SL_7_1]